MGVDDAVANASAAINAVRKTKAETPAEQRSKSIELMRLMQIQHDAARQVIDANAAKRVAVNGHSNGKAAAGIPRSELRELVKVIAQEIAGLQKRIAALEARGSMKYEGVWDPTKAYPVGSFVTDDGSMWHANDTNISVRPGSSDCWQLAIKRGRDGKGSR